MRKLAQCLVLSALVGVAGVAGSTTKAESVPNVAGRDAKADEVARGVMDRMGGQESWDATRYIRWNFFARRTHYWDRRTGRIRIEVPDADDRYVILMNIHTKNGRVWKNGEQLDDPADWLQKGHEMWVNDSYWMFMPYKLMDPGVKLAYAGKRAMQDGRMADVLDMTFIGVGYTPENRYEIFVAEDTGLVEQWTFYSAVADKSPRFTLPWAEWKPFGSILLATSHGRDLDWEIAVFDELPDSLFANPEAAGD